MTEQAIGAVVFRLIVGGLFIFSLWQMVCKPKEWK